MPRVEAIAPVSDPWAPSGTSPRRAAPVVPPTVVTQGLACAANARSPALPAAATTTTSASAAPEQGALHGVEAGRAAHAEVEDVDAVAGGRSIAVTRSAVAQPSPAGSGAIQHAL